jgi:molecular chaperone HscB
MILMNYDFSQDHFRLFGLPRAFNLDPAPLEQTYREMQSQVHPDRFAHLGETERRLSMQWSTHVNEAYQTLKKPLSRACYLLQLNGVDALENSNTAMPAAFLMQQMEWREAVMEAKVSHDVKVLEQLERELKEGSRTLTDTLQQQLDVEKDYPAAGESVRKLRFMEKLMAEIHDAYEALES